MSKKKDKLEEFRGTVNDMVAYQLNGVQVIRKKSGFSTENFQDNPNYTKVRENSSEFGHCSKAGKLIRQTLTPYIGDCGDKYMYQKFAKLMTQLKDLDMEHSKGQRRIEIGLTTEEGKSALVDFKFGILDNVHHKINKHDSLFTKPFNLTGRTGAKQIQLLTLLPHFDTNEIEVTEQNFDITKNAVYEFNYPYGDDDLLLHFIVLKKDEKVYNAGFVTF